MSRNIAPTQPQTVRELVDLWPTRAAFAQEAATTLDAVNAWIKRGRIPAEHHFDVVTAARVRGFSTITAELIDRIQARAKRSKPPKRRPARPALAEATQTAAE